jgi:hypothetical protein
MGGVMICLRNLLPLETYLATSFGSGIYEVGCFFMQVGDVRNVILSIFA